MDIIPIRKRKKKVFEKRSLSGKKCVKVTVICTLHFAMWCGMHIGVNDQFLLRAEMLIKFLPKKYDFLLSMLFSCIIRFGYTTKIDETFRSFALG